MNVDFYPGKEKISTENVDWVIYQQDRSPVVWGPAVVCVAYIPPG
jgi:hypothetical protein